MEAKQDTDRHMSHNQQTSAGAAAMPGEVEASPTLSLRDAALANHKERTFKITLFALIR